MTAYTASQQSAIDCVDSTLQIIACAGSGKTQVDQLHVHVVGYEELCGERADLVEVLNLDKDAKSVREEVDGLLVSSVRGRILQAGEALRTNHLQPHKTWCSACDKCDFARMCPTRRTTNESEDSRAMPGPTLDALADGK